MGDKRKMTDKDIEVIIKPIFIKMFDSNFSACEYGIECYKKGMEYQLTKAKDHIKKLLDCLKQDTNDPQTNYYVCQYMDKAEQFLKDSEVEK